MLTFKNTQLDMLQNLQSGKDLLAISEAIVTANTIEIPRGAVVTNEKIGENVFEEREEIETGLRNLQVAIPDRKVLVVRITTTGDFESTPSVTAEELR